MKTTKEVCESKQRFESKADAKLTAVKVKGRMRLHPYKCDCCSKWHLTSTVQK